MMRIYLAGGWQSDRMEDMNFKNFDDIKVTLSSTLSPTDKVILCGLLTYRNTNTGRCFPKQQDLADFIDLDRKTVNRCLGRLTKMGVITKAKINTHAPMNYTIEVSALPQPSDEDENATIVYLPDDTCCTSRTTSGCTPEGTDVVPPEAQLFNKELKKKLKKKLTQAKSVTEDSADAPSSSRPLRKRYKLWLCDCGEKECIEKQESNKKESDYSNRLRIRTALLNGRLDWESVVALEYSAEDFIEWPEIEVLISEEPRQRVLSDE